MDGLLQICHEILIPAKRPARLDHQLAVETAIRTFSPDLIEASELMDAVIGALKARYTADRLVVVEEEARALKIALGEAQPQEITKEDLRFDDSRWCNANE